MEVINNTAGTKTNKKSYRTGNTTKYATGFGCECCTWSKNNVNTGDPRLEMISVRRIDGLGGRWRVRAGRTKCLSFVEEVGRDHLKLGSNNTVDP